MQLKVRCNGNQSITRTLTKGAAAKAATADAHGALLRTVSLATVMNAGNGLEEDVRKTSAIRFIALYLAYACGKSLTTPCNQQSTQGVSSVPGRRNTKENFERALLILTFSRFPLPAHDSLSERRHDEEIRDS